MSKVVASFVVTPLGTSSPSISKYVASVLDTLEKYNLKYQLTPMCTVIEGDEEVIFKAIQDIKSSIFSMGVQRVVYTLKVDERIDKSLTIESKLKSVKKNLNK